MMRLGELVVALGDEDKGKDHHEDDGRDGRDVEHGAGGLDGGHIADDGAGIGDHQGHKHEQRHLYPVALADQVGQALARDERQAHPHLLGDPQQHGHDQQQEQDGVPSCAPAME